MFILFIVMTMSSYSLLLVRRVTALGLKVPKSKIMFSVALLDRLGVCVDALVDSKQLEKYLHVPSSTVRAFVFIQRDTNNYVLSYPTLGNELVFEDRMRHFRYLHLTDRLSKVLVPAVYHSVYTFDSVDSAISRCVDYLEKVHNEPIQIDCFSSAPI